LSTNARLVGRMVSLCEQGVTLSSRNFSNHIPFYEKICRTIRLILLNGFPQRIYATSFWPWPEQVLILYKSQWVLLRLRKPFLSSLVCVANQYRSIETLIFTLLFVSVKGYIFLTRTLCRHHFLPPNSKI
jgi:hypothetical protein